MPNKHRYNETKWERNNERRALGLCISCSKPTNEGKSECEFCLSKRREKQNNMRAMRKANKLCVRCGTPNANGKKHCDTCLPLLNLCIPAPEVVKVRATVA